MTRLLQINTSLFGDSGQSSQLAEAITRSLIEAHPGAEVQRLDLASDPVPHLTAETFQAFATPAEKRTVRQRDLIAPSDVLIAQLAAADVLVLGLPLYNYGVPSALKAYFDHIARAGVTFRYTPAGPVGLLRGKKALVAAARGGLYRGTPADTQTPYVRDFLRFIGIDDVQFIYAEGLALDAGRRNAAIERALADIPALAA